jgi:hypothetical protein
MARLHDQGQLIGSDLVVRAKYIIFKIWTAAATMAMGTKKTDQDSVGRG